MFPRTSQLCDPAVANVDHTLLVFTFDMPPFEPANATRYLVAAEATDVPLTVVVNKADIVDQETVARVLANIQSWGYDAVPVSTVTGQGIPELTELLRDRVAVLAGPSGVGKSSIINALRLHAAQQAGGVDPLVLPWVHHRGEQPTGVEEGGDDDEWVDEVGMHVSVLCAVCSVQSPCAVCNRRVLCAVAVCCVLCWFGSHAVPPHAMPFRTRQTLCWWRLHLRCTSTCRALAG